MGATRFADVVQLCVFSPIRSVRLVYGQLLNRVHRNREAANAFHHVATLNDCYDSEPHSIEWSEKKDWGCDLLF